MRDDMHKVLCEHPRGGWRVARRQRYRGPLEDAPRREPISRHRGGTKHLSENLGPLRRWLLAQAGRPWDAVHGELRARIHPGNAVQLHIWQHAQHYVQPRVALVGDAAHVVHPLAGQGVNLGLLDAAALAELVLAQHAAGRDPGGIAGLRRYERARKGDNLLMQAAMDGFKRLFGSPLAPVVFARNAGLLATNALGPLKHLFARRALGFGRELPPLARGV